MDVKELNNRILGLEKKYSTKQDQVSNYYKELLNTFYEYADSNYNTDYEMDCRWNSPGALFLCDHLLPVLRQLL